MFDCYEQNRINPEQDFNLPGEAGFRQRQDHIMQRLAYPKDKVSPYIVVITTYTLYIVLFATLRGSVGLVIGATAVMPVVAASWYFGFRSGIVTAVLCILNNIAQQVIQGISLAEILINSSEIIGFFSLAFISFVVGNLKIIIEERSSALLKLEQYELERKAHTDFLEQLNSITGRALEAESLKITLEILVERIGELLKADDCFFSLWDETKQIPIPAVAYGSLRDTYSFIQFEPNDRVPSTFALEIGEPIAIEDLNNSLYIDPKIAAIYPSHSMLVIPLSSQNRKLGSVMLGYNKKQSFAQNEMDRAQLAAEQIAQVLSKSLLLEEERKQVKQLTVLHDIALISIDVDNEDELINRVTVVIGQTLFPDNFGILLLDEQSGVLKAHPSYRFFSAEEHHMMDVPLDQGITGQVARTGKAQRLGNVRRVKEYLDVDERTVSELSVPIKFKEHILGVINAESTKRDAFTEDDERLLITLAGQIATALEQLRKAQAERKWLDQLAHSNDLIYALAQITTHIEKAFSIDDIIQNLGAELNKIDLTCIMADYDKERDLFTVNYTSMEPQALEIVEDGLGTPLIKHVFSPDKLGQGNLLHPIALSSPVDEIQLLFARIPRQGVSEMLQAMGIEPGKEPLRLPLIFEENLLGILWIWGKDLTKADLPIMSIFAKQIGISLERARLFQEVQSLALTDHLTGLQNRRSLFELGRVEFARAHRMNRPFCCMMLDLDHFKQINDAHGHPVGDQVLKEFARRCKISVREIDLVGRYGGEELIILLPETDRKTSIKVAERLRASIAATPITVSDKEIAVTVSIGVATKDENTTHLEALIARADQAMYIAKHKGRNRVAMSK
jgi:diguanylate cyclase (GGDEF)-like protein